MKQKSSETSIKKSKIPDPVPKKYRNLVDKGLIGESDPQRLKGLHHMDRRFGELFDVYQMAKKNKPTAVLDFSKNKREHLKRTLSTGVITDYNKMIKYLNGIGVGMISREDQSGSYLKTSFFRLNDDKSFENALKILYYLQIFSSSERLYQAKIGIILGYDFKHIQKFLKRNYDASITRSELTRIQKSIEKKKISLDKLNKNGPYRFFVYDKIPKL